MATTKLVTADDLWTMDEDRRFELIEGVLYEVAASGMRHGIVGGRFATHLGVYALNIVPGEVVTAEGGFLLEHDPDTILAPAVAFVRSNRLPPEEEQIGFGRVIPDLVVEVVSPSDRMPDVRTKVRIYLNAGVPLVWVADPREQSVSAHTADGHIRRYRVGEDLDGGDVLPGFRVAVAAFFAPRT